MIKRKASAVWKGSLEEGIGTMSVASGVLNQNQYSFKTRAISEDGRAGTNPEELLAAAHAGCYAMEVGRSLGLMGYVPDFLEVEAILVLDVENLMITTIELTLRGSVPGLSQEQFQEITDGARKGCIVSKAIMLGINITLNATLV